MPERLLYAQRIGVIVGMSALLWAVIIGAWL
jgi:hypothetical protein